MDEQALPALVASQEHSVLVLVMAGYYTVVLTAFSVEHSGQLVAFSDAQRGWEILVAGDEMAAGLVVLQDSP